MDLQYITADLTAGDNIRIGNRVVTVLEINGNEATIIIEDIDDGAADVWEDEGTLTSNCAC